MLQIAASNSLVRTFMICRTASFDPSSSDASHPLFRFFLCDFVTPDGPVEAAPAVLPELLRPPPPGRSLFCRFVQSSHQGIVCEKMLSSMADPGTRLRQTMHEAVANEP